jgi:hypothetical protein
MHMKLVVHLGRDDLAMVNVILPRPALLLIAAAHRDSDGTEGRDAEKGPHFAALDALGIVPLYQLAPLI